MNNMHLPLFRIQSSDQILLNVSFSQLGINKDQELFTNKNLKKILYFFSKKFALLNFFQFLYFQKRLVWHIRKLSLGEQHILLFDSGTNRISRLVFVLRIEYQIGIRFTDRIRIGFRIFAQAYRKCQIWENRITIR